MIRISRFLLATQLLFFGCNDRYIDVIPYDNDHFLEACDVTEEINSFIMLNYQGTKRSTPDKKAGSCWNTDKPIANVWFKFLATSTGTISILVSSEGHGEYGGKILLALWEADGMTELECSRYINDLDDVALSYTSLTQGEWYYFSVDVADSASRGTFYLTVKDHM
jgi:hypothetical protein